jgi:hypothetical protein
MRIDDILIATNYEPDIRKMRITGRRDDEFEIIIIDSTSTWPDNSYYFPESHLKRYYRICEVTNVKNILREYGHN